MNLKVFKYKHPSYNSFYNDEFFSLFLYSFFKKKIKGGKRIFSEDTPIRQKMEIKSIKRGVLSIDPGERNLGMSLTVENSKSDFPKQIIERMNNFKLLNTIKILRS
jgi:hypothetical protein